MSKQASKGKDGQSAPSGPPPGPLEAPEQKATSSFGSLQVTVHCARNLFVTQSIGKQDPYVELRDQGTRVKRSKVSEDTHKEASWQFTADLRVHVAASVILEVWNKNVVKDDLIGRAFIPVRECTDSSEPRWIRIGRGEKGVRDAGEVQCSFKFQPDPSVAALAAPAVEEEIEEVVDEEPAAADPNAPFRAIHRRRVVKKKKEEEEDPKPSDPVRAPEPAPQKPVVPSVAGEWRVATRDRFGRDRSYGMVIEQLEDGSFAGSGTAADGALTFAVVHGCIIGDRIVYNEEWKDGGSDAISAPIRKDGSKFKFRRDDGSTFKAKKLDGSWSEDTHPEYFCPYYDLTGAWRVYVKQGRKEKSYNLELIQSPDGQLSGSCTVPKMFCSIKGAVKGTVVKYEEHWPGAGGIDHIEAELREDGTYFVCKTTNAEVQAARLIVAMSDSEKLKYNLPWSW